MQSFDNLLANKGILLKKSKSIDLKEFTKIRSYKAVYGVLPNSYNALVFYRDAKSRFVTKDALKLFEISNLIQDKFNIKFGKRFLFYNSEICSKSLALLKDSSWRVYAFV